jgi:hypothetical protein
MNEVIDFTSRVIDFVWKGVASLPILAKVGLVGILLVEGPKWLRYVVGYGLLLWAAYWFYTWAPAHISSNNFLLLVLICLVIGYEEAARRRA